MFVIGWIVFWIWFVVGAHRKEMRQDYTLTHDEYWQQLEDFHKRNGTWVGHLEADADDTSPSEAEPPP